MSEHTKMHPANSANELLYISYKEKTYALPKKLVENYELDKAKLKGLVPAELVFARIESELGTAAVLLKGLRTREALSQVEFAKKIKVTQANLSNMENGRRAIGKIIAKRIEKVFGVDYRYFLE